MPLNNCKVELKHRWTNDYVLYASGADNSDVKPNHVIFTIKDTKLYVLIVAL